MEKIWETHSPAETAALGEEMGKNAQRGQIYCLTGDLGTGKTVFTKGFAAGLGGDGSRHQPYLYHCQ